MYKHKKIPFLATSAAAASLLLSLPGGAMAGDLSPMEELGKRVFFDKISEPGRQSCASCHDPRAGWTSPNLTVNRRGAVVPGAKARRAGNRKPPSTTYATLIPDFTVGRFGPNGGNFWDGRATGGEITDAIFPDTWPEDVKLAMAEHLGPAADQALKPFENPVEQNTDRYSVCKHIESSRYGELYEIAWGEPIDCSGSPNHDSELDKSFKRIAFSIAVYEASDEVNSFSSRRDIALANDADGQFPLDTFTEEENVGHDLFYDRLRTGCAAFCHSNSFGGDGTDPQEVYTASGYFNIGVPPNPQNPWYRMDKVIDEDGLPFNLLGRDWVDLGVGGREDGDFADLKGEFKTPSLRNVDKRPREKFVRAYAHNGYFKSLKSIVHFYNTRDVKPTCTDKKGNVQRFVTEKKALKRDCWPAPEVIEATNIFGCVDPTTGEGVTYDQCKKPANFCDLDPVEAPRAIGHLCLTDAEEDKIVAYLKTLTDTVTVKPPKRYRAAKH